MIRYFLMDSEKQINPQKTTPSLQPEFYRQI